MNKLNKPKKNFNFVKGYLTFRKEKCKLSTVAVSAVFLFNIPSLISFPNKLKIESITKTALLFLANNIRYDFKF